MDLCESFKQFTRLHENCSVNKEKSMKERLQKVSDNSRNKLSINMKSTGKLTSKEYKAANNIIDDSPRMRSTPKKQIVLNDVIDKDKEIYIKTPYGLMPIVMMNKQNEGPVLHDPRITFDNLSLNKLETAPGKNLISDFAKSSRREQKSPEFNKNEDKEDKFFADRQTPELMRKKNFSEDKEEKAQLRPYKTEKERDYSISKEYAELQELQMRYGKKKKPTELELTLKMKRKNKGEGSYEELPAFSTKIHPNKLTEHEETLLKDFLQQANDIMSNRRDEFDFELITKLNNSSLNKSHIKKFMDILSTSRQELSTENPVTGYYEAIKTDFINNVIESKNEKPASENRPRRKTRRTKKKPRMTSIERRIKEKMNIHLTFDDNNKLPQKQKKSSPIGKLKKNKLSSTSPLRKIKSKNTETFNVFKNSDSNELSLNRKVSSQERQKRNQYLY